MRAGPSISLLLIVFTTNIWADLSIRYDVISKNHKKPINTVLIKQDLVRINQIPESQSSVMIDLNSGDIVQIHSQSRRYFKINAHTLGQYASFYKQNKTMLQGLIDQGLQQLNPQKRGQVEQFIQNYNQGSASLNQLNIKPTRKTDTVLGVECKVLAIFNQGKLQREVCISNYQQLGLKSSDVKSLEQLKNFVQQFKQSAPREQQEMLDLLSSTVVQLNGLPMKLVNYHVNGKVRNIIQAGSISFRSIPAQAYRIPEDYQQQRLPVL